MKLYLKLALTGMKKNRRLYLPYMLTCVGMVMMFYILMALSYSPLLREMKGGGNVGLVLSLGKFVIAVFALIFLTYTNSFLLRRRNREFGLYNILGMDRRGIGHIIAWESLLTALIGLVGGITLGVVFSKFAELGLLNAIKKEVDYGFTVTPDAIVFTAAVFAVIFALLFVRARVRVSRLNTLELVHSENTGEKPPKANWLLAVLGALILAAAYSMAVTIRNPLAAMAVFFIAVILVIIATYLLFTAGSVALCRALQRNEKYYYRKQHFVSVASMVYRMKRNGAGLASICILATMVLVMISSTTSLYFGAEDALRTRYPKECEIAVNLRELQDMDAEKLAEIRTEYEACFAARGLTPERVADSRFARISGLLTGECVNPDSRQGLDQMLDYEELRQIVFVSAGDYNRAMGTQLSVAPGTALVCPIRCTYGGERLTVGAVELQIAGTLTEYPPLGDVSFSSFLAPSILLVVDDYALLAPLVELTDDYGYPMLELKWYYGYDLEAPAEEITALFDEQTDALGRTFVNGGDGYSYYSACRAEARDDFYTTFGGLFFLGIILSIVFIFAAVLIIYYKQISEGYEDQSRFEIMQKVGMTKEDIKKSINSQVLTVFFAPLLLAGVHLCFAFPMVWKCLQLFNLYNLTLVVLVTVGAFAAFGVLYALIYKATARSYYNIVSGARPD